MAASSDRRLSPPTETTIEMNCDKHTYTHVFMYTQIHTYYDSLRNLSGISANCHRPLGTPRGPSLQKRRNQVILATVVCYQSIYNTYRYEQI